MRFADDFGITGVIGAGVSDDYWLVPFDANDPVHTPRDLDLANPVLIEALRTALAAGVDRLVTASLPMNAPWEDLQFRIVGDERIPVVLAQRRDGGEPRHRSPRGDEPEGQRDLDGRKGPRNGLGVEGVGQTQQSNGRSGRRRARPFRQPAEDEDDGEGERGENRGS